MKLIVGKNSRLVRLLKIDNSVFDIISHRELTSVDQKKYDQIYLFSWSGESYEDNMIIISLIEPNKLVFVSTSAVYSQFYKPYKSKYPDWKFRAEKFVLSRGSKIVRFGICDEILLNGHGGHVPFTEISCIESFLSLDSIQSNVYNCFNIVPGRLNGWKSRFSNILNFFSKILPKSDYGQLPVILICKILGVKDYGYTHFANMHFASTAQIGFGVLGQAFYTKRGSSDLIFVSALKDKIINKNGFKNTYIGKSNNGLAKYWHGVSISELDGINTKVVPLFIKRKASHFGVKFIKSDVLNIRHINNCFVFKTANGDEYISNKCILAAGPIENVRLLFSLLDKQIQTTFDDHEIANLGSIDLIDGIDSGLVKKFYFLLIRNSVKIYSNPIEHMIDARPFVKPSATNHLDFYNTNSLSIIKKLMLSLSFDRINEAIFNKFGVGIVTQNLSIYVQALAKDCISYNGMSLNRRRIDDKIFEEINSGLKIDIKSFKSTPFLNTIDAQHLVGAEAILHESTLKKLLIEQKLFICGSPTAFKLSSKHHTTELISQI